MPFYAYVEIYEHPKCKSYGFTVLIIIITQFEKREHLNNFLERITALLNNPKRTSLVFQTTNFLNLKCV